MMLLGYFRAICKLAVPKLPFQLPSPFSGVWGNDYFIISIPSNTFHLTQVSSFCMHTVVVPECSLFVLAPDQASQVEWIESGH